MKHFEDDETILKAVLYDFIIGEASANIPEAIQQGYSDLPWRLVKDMRNVAAHEYFQLDISTIWRTIHRSLPPLVEPLQSLLDSEQPS